MDEPIDPSRIRAIAATLNREMCRPIDQFRADLDQFLNDPATPLSAVDRAHALTMRQLCDELRTLTDECLGPDAPLPLPPEAEATDASSVDADLTRSQGNRR